MTIHAKILGGPTSCPPWLRLCVKIKKKQVHANSLPVPLTALTSSEHFTLNFSIATPDDVCLEKIWS